MLGAAQRASDMLRERESGSLGGVPVPGTRTTPFGGVRGCALAPDSPVTPEVAGFESRRPRLRSRWYQGLLFGVVFVFAEQRRGQTPSPDTFAVPLR